MPSHSHLRSRYEQIQQYPNAGAMLAKSYQAQCPPRNATGNVAVQRAGLRSLVDQAILK